MNDDQDRHAISQELLPVRQLNQFVYCPRLFHLEYVQGFFAQSADTLEGSYQHEKRRPSNPPQDVSAPTWPASPRQLHLADEDRGLVGVLDALEWRDGELVPVDAKHGRCPQTPDEPVVLYGHPLAGNAWPNDQVQLCAQAFLLEASGHPASRGFIYYTGSRKRVEVAMTPPLREATAEAIRRARGVAQTATPPPPLCDSPKCVGCSLNAICLPDETLLLMDEAQGPARKLIPGRDDAGVLYLTAQGTGVYRRGECLRIEVPDKEAAEIALKDIAHLALFGNVQITAQALHAVLRGGRTVAHLSSGGWLYGVTHDFSLPNVLSRRAQLLAHLDPHERLRYARAFVAAKVHNQRVLLMRNTDAPRATRDELKDLARRAEACDDIGRLLGLEGRAAALYFGAFPQMLSGNVGSAFEMSGRSRRPPRDPINALLSFGYALLARDFYAALVGVGLDPLLGFLHDVRPGRPALALDLMEAYRPLIVDSTVIRAVNTTELIPEDFEVYPAQALLSKAGRRKFISAYERRMDEMITHPEFGYSLSYRRTLSVECRLLSRVLLGEAIHYRPLRTR